MIGITIEWAPNPLKTVVRLDEAGRRILWLRLKLEDFENRLVSAALEIGNEMFAKDRAGNPVPLETRVATALREINMDYILGDVVDWNGKKLDARIDEQVDSYAAELLDEHSGDCTCVPYSCAKCHAEGLMGIRTIIGLGKHEAAKIAHAFRDGATIDEAVERLRIYRPVYVFNERWPEEDWSKNVPRWVAEGRRAFEWLDAYRREYFANETTVLP